jgi:hypothetical protein
MGRHLTVSRRSEAAPIDAMLWLLEPDVRLVDTQTFSTLGDFASWLRRAIDVSVSWTDELKADAELAMTVAEILGAAPGDPSLPTVNGTDGTETFPFPPPVARSAAGNALDTPHSSDSAGRLGAGRPKGQRHRR